MNMQPKYKSSVFHILLKPQYYIIYIDESLGPLSSKIIKKLDILQTR